MGRRIILPRNARVLRRRAVTLASQVRRFPGRIDVYETNPKNRWADYDRTAATAAMRSKAGNQYSYWNLLRSALLHLPVARIFVSSDTRDRQSRAPHSSEYCSQACASADRIGGGVDPVPNLHDRLTEPSDLARSPFYRYRFTLIATLLFALLFATAGTGLAQPCLGGRCPAPAQLPPIEQAPAAMIRLQHQTARGRSAGSGTIIEVRDGLLLILSCEHLFDDGPGHTTRLTRVGTKVPADVVAVDPLYDLSLLTSRLLPGEDFPAGRAVTIAAETPTRQTPVRSCGFGPRGDYFAPAVR